MSSGPPPANKKTKIKLALKSAARLPYLKAGRNGRRRNTFVPRPGEAPAVIFRLQVLGCTNLLGRDRATNRSDPFVVVSVLNKREQTPVVKRTLNPAYSPKDATFDFPIYLSLADHLGVVELVVWDKDMLSKDYLGEVSLPLEHWFINREDGSPTDYGFDHPGNKPISVNLVSTHANVPASGSIQFKLGFVAVSNSLNPMSFDQIFSELVKRSRPSLVSAPPTQGIGTIQIGREEYEDDGGLSSESEYEDDEGEQPEPGDIPPLDTSVVHQPSPDSPASVFSMPEISIQSNTPPTPTLEALPPSMPLQDTPKPFPIHASRFIPKNIVRKLAGGGGVSSPPPSSFDAQGNLVALSLAQKRSGSGERKIKFGRNWKSGSVPPSPSGGGSSGSDTGDLGAAKKRPKNDFQFKDANDIVGIVMLEIQGADDLPRLANMTRTGWDMDPFVVISFGKKVFRTRVVRHSLSPVWDEKLLFHVRRYETSFKVQLQIFDWDKLSANDHIGDASFDVKDLIGNAPQPDPVTGLYPTPQDDNGGEIGMTSFKLQLKTAKGTPGDTPVIRLQAKYQPYAALRQRFWRQYLKQYDTDNNGIYSHLELNAMLDSLGSTLTQSTVSSFFTRYQKSPHEEEISTEQAVLCLESEIGRPDSEKKRVNHDDSVSATPVMLLAGDKGQHLHLELDKMDFSSSVLQDYFAAPPLHPPPPALLDAALETPDESSTDEAEGEVSTSPTPPSGGTTNGESSSTTPALNDDDDTTKKKRRLRFRRRSKKAAAKDSSSLSLADSNNFNPVERVINVKSCPLCHRPRLNSKAEIDIITHLAVCASQDWNKVDRIVVGNFVTANQAQRKWYTKMIKKVSSGDYKLGANSANIIVQNRMTGQLEEEKMQVYVRLGIRLLYKGITSQMEGGRARRLLKSLSIKQGIKYDDPESAKDIPGFIQFHGLNIEDCLDPLSSFKTFNQFFYRKLKPSTRPLEDPTDAHRLVSAADCRLMVFETVNEATRLWIKGREFSVGRLLGNAYKGEADKYTGGALAIFRLAPQDYHRFHSPVEGRMGRMTDISGEYYTVNPQAIRSSLDVYGENVRKIVPIDSPQFGRVMAICVGAMMVGSIKTTVEEGDYVQRGQEFGFFAFGGSTIVLLFEKGKVVWDEDLLINGRASLETLVRVGMGIGRSCVSAAEAEATATAVASSNSNSTNNNSEH